VSSALWRDNIFTLDLMMLLRAGWESVGIVANHHSLVDDWAHTSFPLGGVGILLLLLSV